MSRPRHGLWALEDRMGSGHLPSGIAVGRDSGITTLRAGPVPHSGLGSQIYRVSKEEEANRALADASPSPVCRRGTAQGKRKILRFCVVAGDPMFTPRGESDAAQIGVVELVLAIGAPLGGIPSK
jgi:hypothetical protein